MNVNELTFGVEIECYAAGSMSETADVLTAAGAAVRYFEGSANRSQRAVDGWVVKYDGSLSTRTMGQGREVVSPVLRGEAGIDELVRVMTALQRAGHVVDTTCGLHVHIGVAGMSAREIAAIATRYAVHGADISATLAPSRTGNRYAAAPAPTSMIQRFEALPDHATSREVAMLMGLGSKYHTVNLATVNRQSTVEFRQHQGSTNPERVVQWVRFLRELVIKAVMDVRQPAAVVSVPRLPVDLFRPGTQLRTIYDRLAGGQVLALDALAADLGTTVAKARTQVFNVVRHLKGRGGVTGANLITRTGRRGAPTTFALAGVSSTERPRITWGSVYDGISPDVAEHRRARAAYFLARRQGRAA